MLRELWDANPDAYTLGGADREQVTAQLGERVRIDQLLRDGDEVAAGDDSLTVVTTSGHSPGHIAVLDRERGVLFTFDDVQGAGLPIAGSDVELAPLYHDVERYLTGLERLRRLAFDVMVPAHGEHLDRDAALARIDESVAFVERADRFVAGYLDRHREVGLHELASAMATGLGRFGGVNLQTMSIARAHLDHQVRQGTLAPVWRRAAGREQR